MAESRLEYKKIISKEYLLCGADPIYFMKKYVWIQTNEMGRSLFLLYPFQEKVLHLFDNNDRNIVLKSRQLGITTLIAGFALWCMIFNKDYKVLALAPTQEKAIHILDKVVFAYENLPAWFRSGDCEAKEKNKKTLALNNGSVIKALTGSSDSARGFTGNLLVIDEAAFIDNAEELWGSSQQTLAMGGRAIILSTPNGHGNFFHKSWIAAESSNNDFLPIKLKWNLHPDRDQKWRDKQTVELGEKMASQECDCDFLTSGDGYFDEADIKFTEDGVIEPVEKRGERKSYWIWNYPVPGKTYVLLVDVARGDGSDSSTMEIMELDNWEQVAEFKDAEIGTKEFSRKVVSAAIEYNNAFTVIDHIGLGWSVVSDVVELGYKNLHYSPKSDILSLEDYINKYHDLDKDEMVPGFKTSTKNRQPIVNALGLYTRSRSIKMKSSRYKKEMDTFIWKNGKPQAMRGYNDDLILPVAIGTYLRDTVFEYRSKGIEITRSALNNIRRITSDNPTPFMDSKLKQNPYSMNINGIDHDLRWLLQ